jgi:hypothetical protein
MMWAIVSAPFWVMGGCLIASATLNAIDGINGKDKNGESARIFMIGMSLGSVCLYIAAKIVS